eukprot:TRINITY_DN156_c0_g1_i6.p2 TRINITY_DN156_c0_g1~~TRINITY_DN156_c0_g1_i6.p2  ORF type:complete len:158 (+),score=27.09 TRINITY_DN156_c0_g1_i6:219-692(+)
MPNLARAAVFTPIHPVRRWSSLIVTMATLSELLVPQLRWPQQSLCKLAQVELKARSLSLGTASHHARPAICVEVPSSMPTTSPSSQPTTSPTYSPTDPQLGWHFSLSPTRAPSPSPTTSPTSRPTVSPTNSPTSGPTKKKKYRLRGRSSETAKAHRG